MYLAIDVGATKTLLAVFSDAGEITKQNKIPTDKDYSVFINNLEAAIKDLGQARFSKICFAIPGHFDSAKGLGSHFGNLDWVDVPIAKDVKRISGCQTVYGENDGRLGGLSEAKLIINEFKKVLYITIGTGIGIAVIVNGVIDTNRDDSGGNKTMFEYDDRHRSWEDFASGRAIVKKYGRKASEIDDPEIWGDYSIGLAVGLKPVINAVEPDIVVIGGGVGAHFEKFETYLKQELTSDGGKIPPIIKAQRPEEAVIYGCYDFIRQNLGT